MKVQNITDIDKFFKVIDVSMANIFSNGEIPELEIIAYEKEDIDRLVSFMING